MSCRTRNCDAAWASAADVPEHCRGLVVCLLVDSAVCRTVSNQRRTAAPTLGFIGWAHVQRWRYRWLSCAGMVGRYLRPEADHLVVLPGRAGTLIVLLSVGPRHACTTCYGCSERLFHRWPICVDDDLS